MISIDGYEWNVPCDVQRTADITPSDISGLMLDKTYFNDVLGTYFTFDVTMAVPPSMAQDYYALYDTLTDPVDAHVFIMPYNDSSIQITARVEQVTDVLVYTVSQKQYWKGVHFTIIANHPTKTMDINEVLTRGVSPLPEIYQVAAGTTYTATDDGWVVEEHVDADSKRY